MGGSAEVVEARGEVALHLRPPHRGDLNALGLFLGQDEEGTSYVAVVGDPVDEGEPREWRSLRDVAVLLSDRDSGLFTTALALANWHAKHTHCPRCGSATTAQQGGWVRRCTDDGSEHYPRTDPAVIMLGRRRRRPAAAGRQTAWPEGRFSTLAGFVEPGESLEAAVRREVARGGRRRGRRRRATSAASRGRSRRSLMLGLHRARAEDRRSHRRRRRDRRGALVHPRGAGRQSRPAGARLAAVSIARRLIEHWYGAEIDQPVEWTAPNRPTEQKG